MTSISHNQSLLDYNNNNNINNINNISKSLEYEKLIQENVTLKSDNLIFREDIKHLTEVNHNLEKELELSRKKILELVNQNDTLDQHINQKCLEIDKLTQAITRLRLFDNPDMEFVIDNRKNKDQKIRELEFDYKTLNEDKIKIQTEYKIMMERFNEFKKQYSEAAKEPIEPKVPDIIVAEYAYSHKKEKKSSQYSILQVVSILIKPQYSQIFVTSVKHASAFIKSSVFLSLFLVLFIIIGIFEPPFF